MAELASPRRRRASLGDAARVDHARVRRPPLGAITSNKEEAERKFLAKKIAAGDELTEAQAERIEALGGKEALAGAAAPPPAEDEGKPAAPQFQAYVSGLPKATTSASGLEQLQAAASGVVDFVAITDRTTDECRGFGFATLNDQASLDAFVAELNEKALLGSDALAVSVAKKQVLAARPGAKAPKKDGRKRHPKKKPDGDDKEKKDVPFRRRRGKSDRKHPPTSSKKKDPDAAHPPPKAERKPKDPKPDAGSAPPTGKADA